MHRYPKLHFSTVLQLKFVLNMFLLFRQIAARVPIKLFLSRTLYSINILFPAIRSRFLVSLYGEPKCDVEKVHFKNISFLALNPEKPFEIATIDQFQLDLKINDLDVGN